LRFLTALWSTSGPASTTRGGRPTGVAEFPKEVLPTPRPWCEQRYNITRWSKMPKGGHFAAFEQPELFVDDLRAFFATVR
jgi:epoxide hydrolase